MKYPCPTVIGSEKCGYQHFNFTDDNHFQSVRHFPNKSTLNTSNLSGSIGLFIEWFWGVSSEMYFTNWVKAAERDKFPNLERVL